MVPPIRDLGPGARMGAIPSVERRPSESAVAFARCFWPTRLIHPLRFRRAIRGMDRATFCRGRRVRKCNRSLVALARHD